MSMSKGGDNIWAEAEGRGKQVTQPGARLENLRASSLHPWPGTHEKLGSGQPKFTYEQVTCSPGWRCQRWLLISYTPSPLQHHISMIPLHLLPKYHRIPVIVHIQCLTQT